MFARTVLFVYNLVIVAANIATMYSNISFIHAESPVWDNEHSMLYWVDVISQEVHCMNYRTGRHRSKKIGYGEVNAVQPIANSTRLLVAVRSALYVLNWEEECDQCLRLVRSVDEGWPDNVINEVKPDAAGRIWAGTKGPHIDGTARVKEGFATLYSLEAPNFEPVVHCKPVTISNGMAWSHDNSVMYYSDSATRRIDAFQFNIRDGTISNRITIFDLSDRFPQNVIPDGMTIDSEGYLWVALMFGGAVIRIDPIRGELIEHHTFLCSQTTSVAWAGRGLNHLIVTTSRKGFSRRRQRREPLCGKLLIVESKARGLPSPKVRFPGADLY